MIIDFKNEQPFVLKFLRIKIQCLKVIWGTVKKVGKSAKVLHIHFTDIVSDILALKYQSLGSMPTEACQRSASKQLLSN